MACGNGAWLFELRAPETTQLDGYDLSPNCFGAREWLPKNVTLVGGFDALKPLEEDLKGKYDVVHVRAFASIIKNNNVKPFVETLVGLLSELLCVRMSQAWMLISHCRAGWLSSMGRIQPGQAECEGAGGQ